jgi:hypothetical protein
MAPATAHVRHDGDEVLVHRCLGCGVERPNRIAADDNYHLVEQLLAGGSRILDAPARSELILLEFLPRR